MFVGRTGVNTQPSLPLTRAKPNYFASEVSPDNAGGGRDIGQVGGGHRGVPFSLRFWRVGAAVYDRTMTANRRRLRRPCAGRRGRGNPRHRTRLAMLASAAGRARPRTSSRRQARSRSSRRSGRKRGGVARDYQRIVPCADYERVAAGCASRVLNAPSPPSIPVRSGGVG